MPDYAPISKENSLQINTETMEVLFNGTPVNGLLELDLHLEPDNHYVIFKCCLDPPESRTAERR